MTKRKEKSEVLIIGSGAAGSVFAARLSEAGHNVLILEAGEERKLGQLYSSSIWARRLKAAVPHVHDQKDSLWLNINRGEGTGGTALHHYAIWPRYHPEDLNEQSQHGRGLDWPFGYDKLRPHYDLIQKEVGIAGDASLEHWRPPGEPYPLPPVLVTAQGQTIAEGFSQQGIHTAPLPMAILTRPYNGRAPCIWDGWCDAGCPIGALANPMVTYLPQAKKNGTEIRYGCRASRLITNRRGEKITGVEYYQDGIRKVQHAELIIICAFTIETVRLLLNSVVAGATSALGNQNHLIGRYLMTHPSMLFYGMFDKRLDNHLGATGGQLISQDGFEKTQNKSMFGSRQWVIGMAVKPNDILGLGLSRSDIFGKDIKPFLQKASTGLGNMLSMVEDQPLKENRLQLSVDKDQNGVPLVNSTYNISEDAKKLLDLSREEGFRVMKSAGANDIWTSPIFSQHIMGGTVMGKDASDSVCDANGQLHGVSNLFVGGPSLFASSSCVNPTYTIHALADISSKFIIKNWASLT